MLYFVSNLEEKSIKSFIINGALMRHTLKIKGLKWCYLYRAIDADGHTLIFGYVRNEIIIQHMRLLSDLLNNLVNLK
jgi:transposase-like protein